MTTAERTRIGADWLEWDSAHFGVRVGRIADLSWLRVESWAWTKGSKPACLYLLASADDTATIQLAEERGFRLMDVRVTLARDFAEPTERSRQVTWPMQEATDADVDALAVIARTAFRQTRFYADPGFLDHQCDGLYERWLRRECAETTVLIVERDGPAGFITLRHEDGSAEIGLVAVREDLRGQGLGHELMSSAMNWCHREGARRVQVVTQARNVAALRLYERHMFKTEAVEVWMHKWWK